MFSIRNRLKTLCQLKRSGSLFIWIMGMLILIGLTVKDFCPLLNEYQNKNIATQIDINSNKSNSKTPPVSLCMKYDLSKLRQLVRYLSTKYKSEECEECQKLTDQSWDVWRNMTIDILENLTLKTLSHAFMEKLISMEEKEIDQVLSLDNFEWNQPIVDAIFYFFTLINRFDNIIFKNDNQTIEASFKEQNLLDSLLSNHKKKIDKLLQAMFNIFCEHISFRNNRKNYCTDFLSRNPAVFFESAFCLALPRIENLTPLNLIITAKSKKKGVRSALNNTGNAFYIYADHDTLYTPSKLPASFSIYLSEEFGDKVYLVYRQMISVIEKRPGIDCYRVQTPFVCQQICLIQKIIEICKCIPFTYRNHIRSFKILPYCNSISYDSCRLDTIDRTENCERYCENPCEYLSFHWHVIRRKITDKSYDYRALNLTFHPIVSTFVQFRITIKNTREQFLSQIGAIVNFYLGFSGLSMIALAIFCWEFVQRSYSSWKKKSNETNIRKEIENIEMANMKLRLSALESKVNHIYSKRKRHLHF